MRSHAGLSLALLLTAVAAMADDTRASPYVARLVGGEEQYVHVWTLGVEGMSDGSDKLVTIDVAPASPHYGKVVHSLSVGGRGEAHAMGVTDDRRQLWAGRLNDSKIFVFDLATRPARPRLVRAISDLTERTGFAGPSAFRALPGRMAVQALASAAGGAAGIAMYDNSGRFVAKHDLPAGEIGGVTADGHGYDLAIDPARSALLTSSFTGWRSFSADQGGFAPDATALRRFGATVVAWDLDSMRLKKILAVPGAPLAIRWSPRPGDRWAVVAAAVTSKLWLVRQDATGEWQAKEVATIGDPSRMPLPVDLSITADGKGLWVNTFMDGMTRYFDLSNPAAPKETYAKVIGKQVGAIAQSWDGRRVYITSSLAGHLDRTGEQGEQFLRAFRWDGNALTPAFEVDFAREKRGRPRDMKLSARR